MELALGRPAASYPLTSCLFSVGEAAAGASTQEDLRLIEGSL